MRQVQIKGTNDVAEFPDTMNDDEMRAMLQREFSQPAPAGQNVSDALQPRQATAQAYDPTFAEGMKQKIADFLFESGVVSDRYGAQRIGDNLSQVLGMAPVIGEAEDVSDFKQAAESGDDLGMVLAGVGAIPIVGGGLKKAGKALREVESPLYKVHNITEGGLEKAGEFGGIPAPSVAIAGGDTGFESFGDISLVGDKSSFAKDPTFASDVYSPRTPRAKDKIDPKVARSEAKRLSESVDPRIDSGFDSQFQPERLSEDLSRLEQSAGNKSAFLESIGKGINPDEYVSAPKPFEPADWYKDLNLEGMDRFPTFKKFENPEFNNKVTSMVNSWDPEKNITEWWDGDQLSREGQKIALKSIREQTNGITEAAKGVQFDRFKARDEIDKRVIENKESFDAYIRNQKRKLSEGKVFEKWNPNTGTTKRFEANLDNAVKLMKGNIRGGEGFSYGVGSIRAQAVPQLKSMKQIQDRRGQIVGEDQMTMVKEGFDSRLENLYDSIKDNWAYDSTPSFSDFADGIETYAKGDTADFKNLTSEQKNELSGFFNELANAPTNYFEVKPQRAVDINEFYGAAVPDDTAKSVIKGLEAQGLKVVKYKKDERKKAIRELNKKSGGNVFFSAGGAAMLYGATGGDDENTTKDGTKYKLE